MHLINMNYIEKRKILYMNKRIRKKQLKRAGKFTRKFTEKEIWGIGQVLVQYIITGLTQFRKYDKHSYPAQFVADEAQGHGLLFNNEHGQDEMDYWNQIIDEIVYAFSEVKNDYPHSPYQIAWNDWYNKHPHDILKLKKDEHGIETNILDTDGFKITDELLKRNREYHTELKKKLYLFIDYIDDFWD